jgi:hypothetical protein
MARMHRSEGPPLPVGTMTRIGMLGYEAVSGLAADAAFAARAQENSKIARCKFMFGCLRFF